MEVLELAAYFGVCARRGRQNYSYWEVAKVALSCHFLPSVFVRRCLIVLTPASLQIFSSHGQSSTGSVVVTATCATSPLSQITCKIKTVAACAKDEMLPANPERKSALQLSMEGSKGRRSVRTHPFATHALIKVSALHVNCPWDHPSSATCSAVKAMGPWTLSA